MKTGEAYESEETQMVYLDNAASTKPSEAVVKTLNEVISIYGNPSSIHDYGREAFRLMIDSYEKIRVKINANKDDKLIFTSGATMSNNVFIQGFMNKYPDAALIVSEIEHKDILMLADYLSAHKRIVYRIPVYQDGTICEGTLENICWQLKKNERKFLCSIQAANGECGVVQDYAMISKIVHMYGGVFHSDMTQYIPYYPIDVSYVDAFSMSGQKIGCIKGTGLLYIKDGIEIDPVIFGEQGLVGGTENVLGIACLGTAFENLKWDNTKMIALRDNLFDQLGQISRVLGSTQKRLPNNVYVSFDKPMVAALNNFGVMTSSGAACSKDAPSHVVLAMGYEEETARNAVRFSLSSETTEEDIKAAVEAVKRVLWITER
jgi:cysteine desulfurase